MNERRRWRARGMTRLQTQPRTLAVHSVWMSKKEARDTVWDYRSVVEGKGWEFWLEPDDMKSTDVDTWVPGDFRDEVRRILERRDVERDG